MLSTVNKKILVIPFLLILLISLASTQPVAGTSLTPHTKSDITSGEKEASLDGLGYAWFVSETGTGTDCSKTNPGPLKYCVETKAQSGDSVYVGEGTYTNTDPDNMLYIQKSIKLIGSCTWTPTSAPVCYRQDEPPYTASSKLNGENSRRVIAVEGPGISVEIRNFYIYQGNAENKLPKPSGLLGAGGGIFASDLDSLVIQNNYLWSNNASMSGTLPTENSYGGGIYAENVTSLEILENMIIFNSASSSASTGRGGGMYIYDCGTDGTTTIESNRIHENIVGDDSTNSTGAGLYLLEIRNLVLDDNIFEYHNTIHSYWTPGSALVFAYVEADSIDHNIFRDNYGASIVFFNELNGDFTRNTFWDNQAAYDLKIQNANDIRIMNNFFGKWYPLVSPLSADPIETRGGISTLIYLASGCGDPRVDIINNTFGLAEYGVQIDDLLDVVVERNIFIGFTKKAVDVMDPANTNVVIDENLFWDNVDHGDMGTNFWVADPMLVDLDHGDFHLLAGSEAIDKVSIGTIFNDIDDQPRPMGFGVDLGADEFQDEPPLYLPIIYH
jgi:hypothetical protein